jgi:hypothetical protein
LSAEQALRRPAVGYLLPGEASSDANAAADADGALYFHLASASTTDVSICRSEIFQYLRSRRSVAAPQGRMVLELT